jgi:predicted amidohydrolase YtcJ
MKKYFKNKKIALLLGLLMVSMLLMAGCGGEETSSGESADMVLQSTCIYTVAEEEPVSGGIAVKDGKILAVGSMEDMAAYTGEDTEVIDYGDQMIMPGFVDGHTHTDVAETVVGVDLTFIDDRNTATERVKQYIEENPDAEVVVGGGWYAAAWGGDTPDKSYLDAATTEIPVIIWDFDHHCLWVNSKTLDMAGIDAGYAKQMNEEAGQEIVDVDENGEPTGYLQESACDAASELLPEYTADDLKYCIDIWSQYGVTCVNEMSSAHEYGDLVFDQLEELRDAEQLNVRQILSMNCESTDEQLENMAERFNADEDDMINFGGIKVMIDGVASTYNATMLQPYVGTDNSGPELYYDVNEMSALIEKAAKHDLVTHFHVCGDKAVRAVLDAYQNAADNGVDLNPGFSVDHCDTTSSEDISRPGELGISCNLTPDFLAPTENWEDNPYLQVLDENTAKELWNCKGFIDAGANVAFGTDAYCSSYSPFVQMYRAINRVANDGNPQGGYLPEEAINIKQAIYCYTMGSAASCRMEDKVGSLEAGKYADIIVLDTNILNCSPEELFNAGVDVTYMNGKEVYTNPEK